ncbi:MAG: cell division protein FtsA [Candidatus Latescibacteria bacterium]|nr:cell division protein FtsA [Candidatus Latescibacterota bacterium]
MPEDIIAGLDIGTTKIAALIGEREDSDLKILGVGTHPSEGLRRGVVVDIEKTVESIKRAVEDAERMAGIEIDAVYVGIAGDHIHSVNSRGVIAVARGDRGITQKDIDRALDAAKALQIPMDRQLIHVLPQEFIVDDQRGIRNPSGLFGVRLEVLVHIVTGAITSAQNLYKCIRRAGLEVKDLVLEPLASSYAVLSKDEKELGVALLDMGGGTTDLAVFYEGSIRHTAVIGLGGRNITNDIAIGLRTPLDQAEAIKRKHCVALSSLIKEDELIDVPGVGGRPSRRVSKEQLGAIVEPRMEETFTFARREIKKSGYDDLLGTGVVITGGGALMPGTVELAEHVFGMPVKLGVPQGFGGIVDPAKSPMHATGIGLILYAIHNPEKKEWLNGSETGVFDRIMDRMRKWFDDIA